MKTTYVLKELLVQYVCQNCQHTLWKTNKRSKLFPNEFMKECGNPLCASHTMDEPIVDEEYKAEIEDANA